MRLKEYTNLRLTNGGLFEPSRSKLRQLKVYMYVLC